MNIDTRACSRNTVLVGEYENQKRTFSQVSNLEYQDISSKEIGNLVIAREARQNRLTEAFREARSNYDKIV